MHVLVIPYNYPTDEYPSKAIFIQEQVFALSRLISKVGVLGVIPKTISMCLKTKNFAFGKIVAENWVFEVPAIRGCPSINRLATFCLAKRLFNQYLLDNEKPDVVHVHNAQAADIAIWIKKKYNIPFVITEHSSLSWQLGVEPAVGLKKLKSVYEQSSANIAVSKALADHLSAVFNLPFIYIPNVVDTDFFYLNTLRLNEKVIRLVSVGNLTENKNHLMLVKAVHSLINQGYSIRLDIAGGGDKREMIEEYICKNHLENRIKLLGILSKIQVRNLLRKSDFFVLPSIKETFGVVIIEAMACGLPVLAFKAGGPESIITSNLTGLLLNPKDDFEDGLVKFISKCYDSQKIREYAKENFSYEVIAGKLVHQYTMVKK